MKKLILAAVAFVVAQVFAGPLDNAWLRGHEGAPLGDALA